MKNKASFLSEHTCEFLMVPRITQYLEQFYPIVIPIYYWGSREGISISRGEMRIKSFRVMAFYPRRPKVTAIDDADIEVKFNQHLFVRTNALIAAGIPVLAGVPLISNIYEARSNCECAWFRINKGGQEESFAVQLNAVTLISGSAVDQIKLTDFESLIDSQCKLLTGEEIVKIIRSFRSDFDSGFYTGIWGDTYKPIYFLIES
jgi:hypothetical protein